MKKIVILNGAAKKNGNTAALVKAFCEGALKNGNEIQEFYLQGMNIKGCLDCQGCARKEPGSINPCVQEDDMEDIYKAFIEADVFVLASPVYWWSVSGILRVAVDRLYAVGRNAGNRAYPKQSILLMTAGGNDYSIPLQWYSNFEKWFPWKSSGTVLGSGKEEEARQLGASIQ